MSTSTSVTPASVLGLLSKARLAELARALDVAVPPEAQKAAQIERIVAAGSGLEALLPRLTRDELRAACRAHAIEHGARSRDELMARLGVTRQVAQPDADRELHHSLGLPFPGDIAVVRHRQYLVESVTPGGPGQQTAVKLGSLGAASAGRPLDVLCVSTHGNQLPYAAPCLLPAGAAPSRPADEGTGMRLPDLFFLDDIRLEDKTAPLVRELGNSRRAGEPSPRGAEVSASIRPQLGHRHSALSH